MNFGLDDIINDTIWGVPRAEIQDLIDEFEQRMAQEDLKNENELIC